VCSETSEIIIAAWSFSEEILQNKKEENCASTIVSPVRIYTRSNGAKSGPTYLSQDIRTGNAVAGQ